MPTVQERQFFVREYLSGEVAEPGVYLDMDTGIVVTLQERDSLPEEVRIVRYQRRFRRLESGEETASR